MGPQEALKCRGQFRSIFRKKLYSSKKGFRAKFALQTCHLKYVEHLVFERHFLPDAGQQAGSAAKSNFAAVVADLQAAAMLSRKDWGRTDMCRVVLEGIFEAPTTVSPPPPQNKILKTK